ncbi:hypothetical protein [Corallococcus sp. AB038B]|uniref:hypothetical protein n=1 Tax=Corallococcus sp. AB038B TaxID=2316718 RepID=UPI000EC48E62|nr:hypothetical protein [Corallococcus sp. AB038B]RKH92792.1 hypothetical protein D7Y04_42370 [Corallococcus sp. AB038B]
MTAAARIIKSSATSAAVAIGLRPVRMGRVIKANDPRAQAAKPAAPRGIHNADTETVFALLTVELALPAPSHWTEADRRYWQARAQA